MVLTVSFVLSSATGLVCHRCLRIISANLTPASGRQDHTTSPSASAPFVKGAARVHRIPPRVRDDRETPLCVGRDGGSSKFDLGEARSGIFLQMGLDSRTTKQPVGQISAKSAPSPDGAPAAVSEIEPRPRLYHQPATACRGVARAP